MAVVATSDWAKKLSIQGKEESMLQYSSTGYIPEGDYLHEPGTGDWEG